MLQVYNWQPAFNPLRHLEELMAHHAGQTTIPGQFIHPAESLCKLQILRLNQIKDKFIVGW
ncbi:MAG: hypothetical protein AAF512_26500 [Pseudomonadota bacterium]